MLASKCAGIFSKIIHFKKVEFVSIAQKSQRNFPYGLFGFLCLKETVQELLTCIFHIVKIRYSLSIFQLLTFPNIETKHIIL